MRKLYEKGTDREPAPNRLFLAIVITYLALSAFFAVFSFMGRPVSLPLVFNLISGELTLLIPTLVYLAATRTGIRGVSEKWKLPIGTIPLLVLLAYCILPFISLVNLGSMALGGENAAGSLAEPVLRLPLWLSLLCISVLPGVVEEFIFRGLFYGSYRKRRGWGAVFTSALLFGLMHMNLNQFCYAFVMGIIFALLYEGTGSLTAPMLVHAVYNGNSVIMMYRSADTLELENAGQLLSDMLSGGKYSFELLVTVLLLAVIALIGLAAAGGLYVAVVKLCHREKQAGLLFWGSSAQKSAAFARRQGKEEGKEASVSRKIWGPFLIAGTLISVLAILGRVLILQFA